ncbi:MAG: 2-dehydropantoate 2-reductase [Flavobacteriales bacterium CG_4_8_14_3_um_filter_35_10]|nr:MAG: 2-dehydropantoate 2-reductase [Flavobacteriales bacterium CG_4_8_14_3_um_filter_35_10]
MKIVVVGAGGVGGYFGGRLAQAGFDLTFLLRDAQFEAIKQNGLQVKSIKGDFKVFPKVINDVKTLNNTPDLIILGIKSWQLIALAKQIKPIVGKNTLILPLQNGADNADKLLTVLPRKNVLAGLCRIVSKVESPGIINHFDFEPEIIFGNLNNQITEPLKALKNAFDKAGIKNKLSENILTDIWIKFLFITTYSGIGALTRMPIGTVRAHAYLMNMMLETADEVLQIAQAKKIALTQQNVKNCISAIENLDYHSTASMQRDLMEGKPSELENFNGYIVKQGLELGIKTPINDFIYYCLLPQEQKARKLL